MTRCIPHISRPYACLLLGFSSLMVAARPASADPPRYKVIDLGELGFVPQIDRDGTMGINNKGQVAYGRKVGNPGVMHAWVWLPEADYGLGAGHHDLTVLTSSSGPQIARDLNNAGYVVGQTDATEDGAGLAIIWSLSATSPQSSTLRRSARLEAALGPARTPSTTNRRRG